jgi:basic amino acid/polyamine antiporter, APA family
MKKQGQLVRSLSVSSAVLLVVSSIIGSGIFKKIAPMSHDLQVPGWVLAAWVLAGIVSLCGALSNAEIAGLLADSGGEYVYYRKIYNRWFAFLYGWSSFAVIRSASIASIAYVFAQSLNTLLPLPQVSPALAGFQLLYIFQPFDNLGVKSIAILLILLLTVVNYRGLRFGEKLSNGVTLLVLAGIVLIVGLGLALGNGSFTHLTTPATGYQLPGISSFVPLLFAALLSAFWAYEGWSSLGYIGGEIKNPQKNIPIALGAGLLLVMAVYGLVNFTYLFVLPIDQLIEISETKNAIAAVVVAEHFLGNAGGWIIPVLILVATFGCTNTTILMASRLYYKMAADGLFFKKAAYIHPKFNTPSYSLAMQAFWASMLVLSGSFDQLTDMLIFASFIFYGATAFGVFVLRRKMPDAPRPYRVMGYPVVPGLFVLFCLVLVALTLLNRPREALLGLGLMLTGLPFYFFWTAGKTTKQPL